MRKLAYKRLVEKLIDNNFNTDIEEKNMNTEQQQNINDFRKIWKKSGGLNQNIDIDIDIEADWAMVKSRIDFNNKTKRLHPKKYFMRYAAILIAALGLTIGLKQLLVFYQNQSNGFITEANNNNIKELVLADGTTVLLNKKSVLNYSKSFNKNNRHVILQGEAYFKVAHNANLPFCVFTGKSTVEVLGTEFNIKQYDTIIAVNVAQGHVKLYQMNNTNNAIELFKNEAGTFNELTNSVKKVKAEKSATSWLNARLNFVAVPINEVITSVAKYHNLKYSPAKGFDTVTYTGNLNNKDINEVLMLINLSLSDNQQQLILTDNQLRLTIMN